MSATSTTPVAHQLQRHALVSSARVVSLAPVTTVALLLLIHSAAPLPRQAMWWAVTSISGVIVGGWAWRELRCARFDRPNVLAVLATVHAVAFASLPLVLNTNDNATSRGLQINAMTLAMMVMAVNLAASKRAVVGAVAAFALCGLVGPLFHGTPRWALAGGALGVAVGIVGAASGLRQLITRTVSLGLKNEALVDELQMMNQRLEAQVRSDPLTGLANRFGWNDALSDQSSSEAGRLSVGVLYVDVDRFKAVNDQHGHAVGDDVLLDVAQALSAAVRPVDVVARLGGDEFAVLIPAASRDALVAVAERIRRILRTATNELGVTVSMGGSLSSMGETLDRVLHRADEALYVAKRLGGDQVSLSSGDVLTTPVVHS
jgi:diguanylate cyclase (GGDEF)-like protein